jgi:hypothetical protein
MGNPRVGTVAESTAVVTAETVTVTDGDASVITSTFGQASAMFTVDGVASMFESIPEAERLLLTEMLKRLKSKVVVNGVEYSVQQARDAFKELHLDGIREGKRACSQLPSWAKKSDGPDAENIPTVIDEEVYDLLTVTRGGIDVKANADGKRDYQGVPCILREADSRLYLAIDEFFLELSFGRSRRGAKGYWSEQSIPELIEKIEARLAELG